MTNEEHLCMIGMRIALVRLSFGWLRVELAHETGINRLHLARIERGEANFEFNTIRKICAALEIELSELVAE